MKYRYNIPLLRTSGVSCITFFHWRQSTRGNRSVIHLFLIRTFFLWHWFNAVCVAEITSLIVAKITNLKHSVPKNDKKRKKEVTAEIEKLENELKERHEKVCCLAKLYRLSSSVNLKTAVPCLLQSSALFVTYLSDLQFRYFSGFFLVLRKDA